MTGNWAVTQLELLDSRFPAGIRCLTDRPASLQIAGEWTWIDRLFCIAVVGTRYASSWGARTAFELGKRLAEHGWGVISGLARGIDTAAHQGALAGGGRTGATLPGGLGRIYPPDNRDLADNIVHSGGFLLSEYAVDSEAAPDRFVARDRLQCALSQAVIVVETEPEGGTMHTARFALTQRKPLFVFQPPRESPQSGGNRILLAGPRTKAVADTDSLLVELATIADLNGR